MTRPETSEYAEFYSGYVSLITENEVFPVLRSQPARLKEITADLSDVQVDRGYAEGKWSVKQLIGHINDAERVFGYRAFRIAHSDKTPLASFDQDLYVANASSNARKLDSLLREFHLVRETNLLVLERLSEEQTRLTGTASDAPVSVRALAYIMAGHVRHHCNILKERYLPALRNEL
jgi:uncharacterized damage-inducible protein DinB